MIVFHAAFLILILLVALAALRRPGMAIALLLCIWSIKQALQLRFGFFYTHGLATNMAFAAVACVSLVWSRVRGNRLSQASSPLSLFSFFFVVLAIGSYLWTPLDDPLVQFRFKSDAVYLVLMVLLLPNLMTREEDLVEAVKTYIWLGTLTLCVLFFLGEWGGGQGRQVLVGEDILLVDPTTGVVSVGGAGNPLEVSSLAMRLILVVVLLNLPALGRFWTVLRWGVVALAIAVLIQSASRGQTVATALCLLAALPFSKSLKTTQARAAAVITFLGVVAVVGAIYLSTIGEERWSSETLSGDIQVRIVFAENALRLWASTGMSHIFFGFGMDSAFHPSLDLGFPEVGPVAVLLDFGILGFVLWMICLVFAFKSLVRTYRMVRHDDFRRGYCVVLGVITGSILLLSLKGGGYFIHLGWCLLITRYEYILSRKMLADDSPDCVGDADFPRPALAPSC